MKRIIEALATLLGIVAVLLGLYEVIFATKAVVTPALADRNDTLAAPFYIENPSHLFRMQSVWPSCHIRYGRTDDGLTLINDSISCSKKGEYRESIDPGTRNNYSCSDSAFGTKRFEQLTMQINVDYRVRVFGISWPRTAERTFIYLKAANMWVEGEPLK